VKNLKVIYLVGMIMFILNVTNLFAQAPDTLWTKTYGGVSDDEGFSTCQTMAESPTMRGSQPAKLQMEVSLLLDGHIHLAQVSMMSIL
jgi:hypothetical protein